MEFQIFFSFSCFYRINLMCQNQLLLFLDLIYFGSSKCFLVLSLYELFPYDGNSLLLIKFNALFLQHNFQKNIIRPKFYQKVLLHYSILLLENTVFHPKKIHKVLLYLDGLTALKYLFP